MGDFSIKNSIVDSIKKSFHLHLLLYCFFSIFAYLFSSFFGPLMFLVAAIFFSYKIKRWALALVGIKLPAQNLKEDLFNYLVFSLKKNFLASYCWYDKELLIPSLIFLLLAFLLGGFFIEKINFEDLSFMTNLYLILPVALFILSLIYYLIIFFIHFIRISFSDYLFLTAQEPEQSAIRISHKFIKENKLTLKIFVASLVFFILFLLVSLFLGLILVASFAINLALGLALGLIVFFIFPFFIAISELYYAHLFKSLYYQKINK